MFTTEEHLDDLHEHLDKVRNATRLLGSRLIQQGRKDFGRQLMYRGHIHDADKYFGMAWKNLHCGPDVDPVMLRHAVDQHTAINSHHPEHHGGIHNMSELDIAEMICDCYARSQERGTNIRDWFREEAVDRYQIDLESEQWKWIQNFLDLLLRSSFNKELK